MTVDSLLARALNFDFLSIEEGVFLYEKASIIAYIHPLSMTSPSLFRYLNY
jgi:hypothetical protein